MAIFLLIYHFPFAVKHSGQNVFASQKSSLSW